MSNRWIAYTQQSIPGNPHSDVTFHPSIADAVESFRAYSEAVGTKNCTMVLYFAGDDQSMYDHAKEYENIGCPFDYPDRHIAFGPRGGIKLERC